VCLGRWDVDQGPVVSLITNETALHVYVICHAYVCNLVSQGSSVSIVSGYGLDD
jgi:hypothetical protein